MTQFKTAVLVPCFNEALTIEKVVRDFKTHLANADVYVGDNNCRDATAEIAKKAGACVISEIRQGKGHMMRRLFSEIEADVYLVVDGDDTYDAKSAPLIVNYLIENSLDMVTAKRIPVSEKSFRSGHAFGNKLLSGFTNLLFGNQIKDTLTGYRALSYRFVKSYPALVTRFESETSMTIHALALNMPVAEIETPYYTRPTGSFSTVSTYRDGIRMLFTILKLLKQEKPFALFGSCALILIFLSIAIVPFKSMFPPGPAVIAGLLILGMLCFFTGIILDAVSTGHREAKRLHYLSVARRGSKLTS